MVFTFNSSCTFFAVRSPLTPAEIGTGCANVIPSPATIFRLPSGQGFTPTPRISAYVLNVVSGSLPLPRRFARYARSSTCGERDHLSHVVGDPVVVLSGMSRQIALQTRSEALRRTRRGLNARQGMEGAKNAYRAFQEVRRADTPSQGLSGRQEPRQPPAKPICTVQAATRLVGGRRPSVLQRWGSGVLPRRFPVALKALPEPWRLGRSGDRGAKTRKGF